MRSAERIFLPFQVYVFIPHGIGKQPWICTHRLKRKLLALCFGNLAYEDENDRSNTAYYNDHHIAGFSQIGENMKLPAISANTVLTILLAFSAVTNLALGYRVQKQQLDRRAFEAQISKEKSIIGVKLAELPVKGTDGKLTKLQFTQTDPATIIYVFRPGCGWCAKNLSNIKELSRQLGANAKYRIIGITLDENGLKEYMQRTQLNFPVYSGVSSYNIARLAMGGTPQTILVSNGQVTHNWSGAYSGEVLKDVETTLGIKLPGMS